MASATTLTLDAGAIDAGELLDSGPNPGCTTPTGTGAAGAARLDLDQHVHRLDGHGPQCCGL